MQLSPRLNVGIIIVSNLRKLTNCCVLVGLTPRLRGKIGIVLSTLPECMIEIPAPPPPNERDLPNCIEKTIPQRTNIQLYHYGWCR
jgi:hypothetical protein